MIENPDALWVRIVKGIYFPNKDMFEASRGCHPSWFWSSFLHGRELVKKEVAWQVGDGKLIGVWSDKWIPGIQGMKLSGRSMGARDLDMRVERLIDSVSNSWSLQEIQSCVKVEEEEAIKAIPLPQKEKSDTRIWPLTKSGKYSVKSGYHVCNSSRISPTNKKASSSNLIDDITWKLVWSLDAAPKVISFIRKAILNSIPVRRNLFARKVVDSPICSLCEKEEETVEHCLLTCGWTSGV